MAEVRRMKVSELTVEKVASFIRVDLVDSMEREVVAMAIQGAKAFCASYTGLTVEELDNYEDMPLAVLALCAEFYDLRQFTVAETANINPTTLQILSAYSKNLI